MSRLLTVLLFPALAHAQASPEVVALQKAIHQVRGAAEPAVACILVSRSDQYAKFGEGPGKGEGKLGGFTPIRHRPRDIAGKELVRRLDLAAGETVPDSYGTGVVIDPAGLVLTTFHVIDGATKVYVRLPGENRGSYADIHAADARSDLAVLKLTSRVPDLTAIKIGDSGKVRKGDLVVALTHPFAAGFRDGCPSVGFGTVSNLRRKRQAEQAEENKRTKVLSQYATLMQTDVRLNLGSSGGAILNLDGEMVGLTTAAAALPGGESAGGFAVPMDVNIKRIIEVLKRGEEVEYGFLGVTVNPDLRTEGRGVVIAEVPAGMPAARAGLETGDIVTAIDGVPLKDQDDLFLAVGAALAGNEIEIKVGTGGGARTMKARLAKARHPEAVIASSRPAPVFGLRVDYASTLSIDANPPDGVAVQSLEPGSPAEKALKEWADRGSLVVVSVNGKPVSTPADFRRETAGKSSVTLEVVEASNNADGTRKKVTLP